MGRVGLHLAVNSIACQRNPRRNARVVLILQQHSLEQTGVGNAKGPVAGPQQLVMRLNAVLWMQIVRHFPAIFLHSRPQQQQMPVILVTMLTRLIQQRFGTGIVMGVEVLLERMQGVRQIAQRQRMELVKRYLATILVSPQHQQHLAVMRVVT